MNKKDTTFKDNYFPGVNVSGAYYNENDLKTYLVKYNYLDYKHTDRNVKIAMNLDKENYEPNDTVTFKTNNNETKFRITAISANKDLYYGTNVIKFVSKKG